MREIDGVKKLGRVSRNKADTDKYEAGIGTHQKAVGKAHGKSIVSAAKNNEKYSKFVFLGKSLTLYLSSTIVVEGMIILKKN